MMKKLSLKLIAVLAVLFVFGVAQSYAGGGSVTITEPKDGAEVASPVKVCMEVSGVEVEPAKKGVNKGKGHHHLLVDVDLPENLKKPIAKDANHVHMGDGSTCKELTLEAGKHSIKALFAKGNHVPYEPAITATVNVTVK